MTGAGQDQQDRYADRPAVDRFESDLADDRQGRQAASLNGSSNGQREVRQIVPEAYRSRDNRNFVNTHDSALPSDTLGGRHVDLNPNSQNQNSLNTGGQDNDRSGGNKTSKPDSSSQGPSPSDSNDKPTADSDEKPTDMEDLPAQHSIPTLISIPRSHKTPASSTSKTGTAVETQSEGRDQDDVSKVEDMSSKPASNNAQPAQPKPADLKTPGNSAAPGPNASEAVDDAASPTLSEASTAVPSDSETPSLQDKLSKSKSVYPSIKLNAVPAGPAGQADLAHASVSDPYSKKEQAIADFDDGNRNPSRSTEMPSSGLMSEKAKAAEGFEHKKMQPESLGHIGHKAKSEVQKTSKPTERERSPRVAKDGPISPTPSEAETLQGELSPAREKFSKQGIGKRSQFELNVVEPKVNDRQISPTLSEAETLQGESSPTRENFSKQGAGKQSQFELKVVDKDDTPSTYASRPPDIASEKAAAWKEYNERTQVNTSLGQNDMLGQYILSLPRIWHASCATVIEVNKLTLQS